MPYKTVRKWVPGHYIKVKVWVSRKEVNASWQDFCQCGEIKTEEARTCRKCYKSTVKTEKIQEKKQ